MKTIEQIYDEAYEHNVSACLASVRDQPDILSARVRAGLAKIYATLGDVPCPADLRVMPPLAALKSEGLRYTSEIGGSRYNIGYYADLSVTNDVLESEGQPRGEEIDVSDELAFMHAVWDSILGVDYSILIPWPSVLHTDENHEMHSTATEPAIAWKLPGFQEESYEYWHSVPLPAWWREDVSSEMISSITNAEERRALQSAMGPRYFTILGLTPIDAAEIDGCEYKLFVSHGESWLQMQSPELKDGSRPTYCEPVHESCRTCAEARGYRIRGELECEVTFDLEA